MKRLLLLALTLCLSVAVSAQSLIIPRGSKLFIEPHDGFETYLTAAMLGKKVPVMVVTDRSQADFILTATTERGDKPGWASTIFLGKAKANEDASVTIASKSGTVVWAYSVHKYNSRHGQQSTAEAVAKHLKGKVESGK